ncbi:penicillin acylase family protein [Lysinibacillus odysseyi]|uniref:Beta-lactam antibiotic acylase n=1 Tax=Lysinibacillus odysseyi 34hs-1 = NBRC 100172 TaxID=1220589 RepID=A0A0A3IT86_9BACI|nr:penicillin acylase family protein [Lysinibacillus odysseyi]KGR86093.1 beta-lactam antibiotic acylase [Lysinibacillus odysseyi 34hs-1 = NBRC 100172]
MTKGNKLIRIILWALGIIAGLIAIALIAFNFYIGSSKPIIEGELTVSILEEDVKVVRDGDGVPHIDAQSDADLYRAQGYVQAQDRLFQMDLARRQASGRLAEVVGAAAVENDKFFRTFSLRDAAEKSWDGYDAQSKQVLEWFAEGVNAFMKEERLSYEFKLLGYEPEPWTPIDSLTIGKYMAYDLGGNWSLLAFRHWALNNLPEELTAELIVDYPKEARSIIEANKESEVKMAGSFPIEAIPNEFNGSNNWVVSGEKSETGMPLLADDPHLGLSTPSIWYQMHLQSPEQNVSGVIFAGVPGIILGHNEDVAWGVTNVNPQVQDLYIEKQSPDNPYEFLYDGKYYEAEVRDEPIHVKGGNIVDFEVIVTKHGPVISDLVFDKEPVGEVFSMQWTALEPTRELQAVLGFNKSKNWQDFDLALRDFMAPAQNFVFADTTGTIAYRANGNIPIRKIGEGKLPVPGDSSDYGWEGYIPYEELPTVINPEEGYIATANNKVVGEEYPYYITDFWAQPYRFERIVDLLESKEKLSVQDMKNIQMDTVNLYAAEFLPYFLKTIKEADVDGKYTDIIASLEAWDYNETIDAPQPLVFNFLIEELKESLFAEEIPEEVYMMMPGKYQIMDNLLRDAYKGNEGMWIEKAGGLERFVYKSFEETIKELKDTYGDNYKKWAWGDFHQLTFDHSISAASDLVAWYLNPAPQPVGGSRTTVQAAGNRINGKVNHGASWRFVADVGNLSKADHIVGPGQSGHKKSEWYHDQVDDWAKGNYHTTRLDGEYENANELLLKAGK